MGDRELIALLAMSTAMTALGIDMMLPAFDEIRADLGLAADSNSVTGLVTAYFIGLGIGTLFYGPLSDHKGRRFAMYLGFAVYATGAILAAIAPSLPLVMAARALWGAGSAGPRVVALAVVRDRYSGEDMSRTMSTLMAIFILVPIFAPALGALVLVVASWRWLFVVCALWAVVLAVWARRLPETLSPEHRIPDLRFDRVGRAAKKVITHPTTRWYAVAVTVLYAVFASYLGSAEAITDQTLGQQDAFPLIFGGLAAVMGAAFLVNRRVVQRVGTSTMVRTTLGIYLPAALIGLPIVIAADGFPSLPVFLVLFAVILACHSLLIPNLNTLAMAPMAAVAGTASSVIGATQQIVGASLGAILDRLFDGSLTPLITGFAIAGAIATFAVVVARRA